MVSVRQIQELLKEQRFRCALSGLKLDPSTAALDHKLARYKGGTDEKENLQVIHETVNRMKHTLSTEEFVDWCKLVVTHSQETVCCGSGLRDEEEGIG